MTTNFDHVLRWACPDLADLAIWNVEAKHAQAIALGGALRHPTLWYLHGNIDDVDRIVLGPEGFAQLYEKNQYRAAITLLRDLLASRKFLFVGFSLDDTYFLDQLAWVRDTFGGFIGPHYALTRRREAPSVRSRVRGHNLPIRVVEFEDFGPPLLDVLRQIRDCAHLHSE